MTEHNYSEHLQQAEQRIADAQRRIDQYETRLRSRRLTAEERERAEALLRSMQGALKLYRAHRDSIAQFIAVTRKP